MFWHGSALKGQCSQSPILFLLYACHTLAMYVKVDGPYLVTSCSLLPNTSWIRKVEVLVHLQMRVMKPRSTS